MLWLKVTAKILFIAFTFGFSRTAHECGIFLSIAILSCVAVELSRLLGLHTYFFVFLDIPTSCLVVGFFLPICFKIT